jgi:hypothetical protein
LVATLSAICFLVMGSVIQNLHSAELVQSLALPPTSLRFSDATSEWSP